MYTPRVITPGADFVRAWQSSQSTSEVARKLGCQIASVSRRACLYRKNGVPLKSFTRRKDYSDLAALAAACLDSVEAEA